MVKIEGNWAFKVQLWACGPHVPAFRNICMFFKQRGFCFLCFMY